MSRIGLSIVAAFSLLTCLGCATEVEKAAATFESNVPNRSFEGLEITAAEVDGSTLSGVLVERTDAAGNRTLIEAPKASIDTEPGGQLLLVLENSLEKRTTQRGNQIWRHRWRHIELKSAPAA